MFRDSTESTAIDRVLTKKVSSSISSASVLFVRELPIVSVLSAQATNIVPTKAIHAKCLIFIVVFLISNVVVL